MPRVSLLRLLILATNQKGATVTNMGYEHHAFPQPFFTPPEMPTSEKHSRVVFGIQTVEMQSHLKIVTPGEEMDDTLTLMFW